MVIVAFKSDATIMHCLESITADAGEIVVIDNDSAPGVGEIVLSRFPDVTYVRSGTNVGFAAAVNRGVASTSGDLVLLLNPDAAAAPGALRELAAFLTRTPDAAAAGAALRYPDGRLQWAAAREPRLRDLAAAAVPVLAGLVRSGRHGGYPPHLYERAAPFEVESLIGACVLLRRNVFDAVGGLDERFFLYMEEIDLARRIRGRLNPPNRLYVVPTATAIHISQGSVRPDVDDLVVYEQYRSQLLFFRKHHGRAWHALARVLVLAAIAERALAALLRVRREPEHAEKWRRRVAAHRAAASLCLGLRPLERSPLRDGEPLGVSWQP